MHAFTLKANGGLLRQLITPVEITLPNDAGNIISVSALWDTGASATVVTQKVVDAIGSVLITKAKVNTASEANVTTDVHLIDLYLNNRAVRITGMNVTIGKLTGFDCLIGMDVITLGDFSITNHKGATVMSFRVPSSHVIDYVQIGKKSDETKQANNAFFAKLKGKR